MPNSKERTQAIQQFHESWSHEPLVMDKWLRIQAIAERKDTLDVVKQLLSHPVYNEKVPNKVYALLGGLSMANPWVFHQKDGLGYKLIADQILHLDTFNPLVAARIASAFASLKKFNEPRQILMKQELSRILESRPNLSTNVKEIVTKVLNA